jgi:two-component system KDP operon response regulator KdpE
MRGVMQGQKILVVDDDVDLVRLLALSFSRAGAEVFRAYDGQEALRRFHECRPDLVVLDIMMPGINGWQACSQIRQFSDVPVIMLTVRGAEDDVIRGLQCGAVDFVAKPFRINVLLARARAALRQSASGPAPGLGGTYDDGYLRIDPAGRRVLVRGDRVDLTATEYRLLAYLFRNAGRVLSYAQILDAVWGVECRDSPQYVHVYVYRLRTKLEEDPSQPVYLLTAHGTGYRFRKRATGA